MTSVIMELKKLFRKEVLEAKKYVVPYDEESVKLNQNECPWDLPVELKVQITERLIKTDFNRYPMSQPVPIKKALAKYNNVMPDQIAVSNGSNVMIKTLVEATYSVRQGKVLILDPSFGVYEAEARLAGCDVVRVPLTDRFQFPLDQVLSAIKKEKPSLIFIANPNAPTGNLFSKESLYKVVKAAECLTVIDEAYYPYCQETLIDWLNEFPHLLILRTLSKAFALAGARVGYAIADTEIIDRLEVVLSPFSVSQLSSVVACEVIENSSYVEDYVKSVVKEKRKLFEELQQIDGVTAYPSDTNFILFRTEHAKHVARDLQHMGILIRDVGDGRLLKNCLRVGVGTPEQNKAFLEGLRRAKGLK